MLDLLCIPLSLHRPDPSVTHSIFTSAAVDEFHSVDLDFIMFSSTIRRSTLSAIGRLQSTPTTTARVTFYSTYRILSSDSTAAATSTTANFASASSTSSYASQQTDSSFPQRRRRTKGLEWAIPPNPQLIALGDLAPLPGTMKKPKRVGRGPGSGLGKTAGKGHKGQGQRKGTRKRGFEGGSTPFWRRTPKLGMTNADRYWKMLTPLTVKKIQEFVKLVRIRQTKARPGQI